VVPREKADKRCYRAHLVSRLRGRQTSPKLNTHRIHEVMEVKDIFVERDRHVHIANIQACFEYMRNRWWNKLRALRSAGGVNMLILSNSIRLEEWRFRGLDSIVIGFYIHGVGLNVGSQRLA
jgi:hypothetical protein